MMASAGKLDILPCPASRLFRFRYDRKVPSIIVTGCGKTDRQTELSILRFYYALNKGYPDVTTRSVVHKIANLFPVRLPHCSLSFPHPMHNANALVTGSGWTVRLQPSWYLTLV